MTIKVTYNVTDVYMSQSVSPVYINVSYSDGSSSGGGVWGTITGTLSNQTDLQNALNAKVPYSGATGDVSLGEYGINVGNVIYDTTPTGIPTEQGATYWDADAETVALIMNGTIQKIGEDTFYHVRNTTGSTIAKGTAVRFSGTTGNSGRLLIAPMLADGTYPSQYYMGITSEAIANNADGKVYHFGKMRNINTSAFADGDVLYVSPSVAGALTATAPVAPNNIIVAAAVVHAANNGTLMIRTTLGSNINADEGVLLTTPTANQGLFYDSGLWVNKSITTALGFTPANAATTLTINGVTYDLSTSRTWTVAAGISGSGASGQVTYWTGASAVSGSNDFGFNSTTSSLTIKGEINMVGAGPDGDGANRRIVGGRSAQQGSIELFNATTGKIHLYSYNGSGVDINGSLNIQGGITFTGSITLGNNQTISGQTSSFYKPYDGGTGNSIIKSASSDTLGRIRFQTGASGTDRLTIFGNGNVGVGFGTTDPAVRLGVSGDTLLRGSGATSATTALTVQNSSSTNLFTVRNDGLVSVTNALNQAFVVTSSATTRLAINNTNASPNAGIQLQTNGTGNWSLANYIPGGGTNASFVFYNDRTNTDSFFINGDTNNVGIRTNAPTARLDIPASVTTAASLRIRSGTAPTSPNDGDIWFDGTNIQMRIGGVTKTFTLI